MDDLSEIRKIMEAMQSERHLTRLREILQMKEIEILELKHKNRRLADEKLMLISQNHHLTNRLESMSRQ
jgi:hypothetical protein